MSLNELVFTFGRYAFLGVLVLFGLVVAREFLRWRWPAKLPERWAYKHSFSTSEKLRPAAEMLAIRFRPFNSDAVSCLGPVKGNAARLLFHAGPQNKRGNIHRWDYLLCLKRVGKGRVEMRLELASRYSYLRPHERELKLLTAALHEAFDDLDVL